MTKLAVAVAFLALNFYTYNHFATDPVIPPRTSFDEFPLDLDDWRCPERERMDPEAERNLGVTDYLLCNFVRGTRDVVNVYIGYHATQVREEGGGSRENSIHPPAHCLPGSGWDIIDSRTVELALPVLPVERPRVKRLVIAKGKIRQLVHYWYQSRGRVIAQDWRKILYVGWDRATRGRTDGSLVRFTVLLTPDGGDEAAENAFQDLASAVLPRLPDYVPE